MNVFVKLLRRVIIYQRGGWYFGAARMALKLARLDDALEYQQRAVALMRDDVLIGQRKLDLSRAYFEADLGTVLLRMSRLPEALAAYDRAVALLEGEPWSGQRKWDAWRAALQSNRGLTLVNFGKPEEALVAFDKARELYRIKNLRHRRKLDPFRAALEMNRGLALQILGDLKGARQAFEEARATYNSDRLRRRKGLDEGRARVELNLGSTLLQLGELDAALLASQAAWELFNERRLLGRPLLDVERLKSLLLRGAILQARGELHDAAEVYEAASDFYEEKGLTNRPELDPLEAALYGQWGAVLGFLGILEPALRLLDLGWQLYECEQLQERAELDGERANLQLYRGIVLSFRGDFDGALLACKTAWDLLCREHLKGRHELDAARARVLINLGPVLMETGELDDACSALERAEALYQTEMLRDRSDLDADRARLQINWGVALIARGNLDEAVSAFHMARDLYESEGLRTRGDLDPDRAKLFDGLGRVLGLQGDLDDAGRAFNAAWELYESEGLRSRVELDKDRARMLLNWGFSLWYAQEVDRALEVFNLAREVYEDERLRGHEELDRDRVRLMLYVGFAMRDRGQPNEALAAWEQAEALLQREHLVKDRQGHDVSLFLLEMSQGTARLDMGDTDAALASYDTAWDLCQDEYLRERRELDLERVTLQMNRAIALQAQGRLDQALTAFQQAETYFETSLANRGYLERLRCHLYSNMAATVIDHLPEPSDWAHRRAREMAELLELMPTLLSPETHNRYVAVVELFRRFQAAWVRFSIDRALWNEIPQILALAQGRELAARLLDDIERTAPGPESADALRAYQEQRRALRAARDEIERVSEELQRLDLLGTQMFVATQSSAAAEAAQTEQLAATRQARLEHLQQQEQVYKALRTALPHLRQAAAQEPGYTALAHPYGEITLDVLQSTLAAHEAICLLIDVGAADTGDQIQGVLVIRPDREPQWQRYQVLGAVGWAVRNFSHGLAAQRHYRRGAPPERDSETAQPLAEDEMIGFWPKWDQAFAEGFWQPLAPHLEGVSTALCITSGELHLLPLELGRPQGLALRYYPGLVFYALARGLFEGSKAPQESTHGVGLLGYAGPVDDIPLAEAEVELLAGHLQQRQQGMPVAYPWAPQDPGISVECLHIACHGADRLDEETGLRAPVLMVGDPSVSSQSESPALPYLDMHGVRALRSPPHIVYLSACFGGQTIEDLSGDPTGLISGFFELGTRVVIGSVVAVPDLWAPLLGLLTHQARLEQDLSWAAAFDEAKRRVETGDWYPDTAVVFKTRIAPYLRRLKTGEDDALIPHLSAYCRDNRTIVPVTTELWNPLTDEARLSPVAAAILEKAGKLARPSAAREALEQQVAALYAEALVTRRIPPQPALGALLYGFRIYGED